MYGGARLVVVCLGRRGKAGWGEVGYGTSLQERQGKASYDVVRQGGVGSGSVRQVSFGKFRRVQ